ncbi:hypothetical protein J2Z62_000694 [Mycoplasmoides fastidiosum]|uniref:ABC transporter permease n=1 Tax=Mycoplasmoides fastidiosum TaxID=92758 RepID=A0ABU0LZX9_9BACT|nr:hypothetical protein [Mycoplasmoides fastidiosum]MDQ0514256.1 hypothetical protein [Mycoplasmoides fastidiosum]UUD37336.1 hypothetical protein NPA10_02005 [Mycoplasmoides fastidiosum]
MYKSQIRQFYQKYLTTKIDLTYPSSLNLWKSSVLYLLRSRGVVITSILVPFLIYLVAVLTAAHNEFFFSLFKVFSVFLTLTNTIYLSFELNNTSFFKKILISCGERKYQMLIPAVLVLVFQAVNLGMIVLYISIYYWITQQTSPISPEFFYTIFLSGITSSLIALIIANVFTKKMAVFSIGLFFSFFIILFTNFNYYMGNKFFADLSYVLPYRYISLLEGQSWYSGTPYNLLSANIFDVNVPQIAIGGGVDDSYTTIDASQISTLPHWFTDTDNNSVDLLVDPQNNPNFETALRIFHELTPSSQLEILDVLNKINQAKMNPSNQQPTTELLYIVNNKADKIVNLLMPWLFIAGFFGIIFALNPLKKTKYT